MPRSSWPVRFACSADGLDLALLVKPGGCAPPFLVVCPLGTPARASSELIPAVAEFCDAFLRENACFEFEWRGTGLSAPINATLAMDDLVADVATAADAIGEPFHMLAFGEAAVPALLWAVGRPPNLLSVLLDTPRLEFGFSELVGDSPEAFDRALATKLRMTYDFPADLVAQELVPAYRRDVPQALIEAWALAWTGWDIESLRDVAVPVLAYTGPEFMDRAAALTRRLPLARTMVGRSLAGNVLKANALRDAFDAFWAAVSDEPAVARAVASTNGLSARELDVLGLVAAGKSNRQIAEALVVSEATVATHVRHVLEKTRSANRAEAAAYAVRHGLA